MTQTYKKKLIEVAIPLEAINAASAREKSIRHGHPSTLHLWWARRPLAACRAVLFAQLVDDPSGYVDELLADPERRAQAEAELPARLAAWEKSKASAQGAAANAPEPTLEDVAVEIERKRLFAIIEDLVKWENSTNEEVLERARAEIRRCCGDELPPVYDPFSGGGSIPLEAQRLGLPAYGSDLNPVAVMIGKAMIEIPPKFKDRPPIHPGPKERTHYRNAEGLAEDVKYYGEWMREKAWERIGHLYPQAALPKEYGGGKATVIAWIWARTVPSPDPAFSDVQVPLVSSFFLSSKKGRETWIQPEVDKVTKEILYSVRVGGSKNQIDEAKEGTKSGRGASFRCLFSNAAITPEYIRSCASDGRMGEALICVVAQGSGRRAYLPPTPEDEELARSASPKWKPESVFFEAALGFRIGNYGMSKWSDLFTPRQLVALSTLSNLIGEAASQVLSDYQGGDQQAAQTYAIAVATYLAFAVSKTANRASTICTFKTTVECPGDTFGRHALPMTWDFAESNCIGGPSGSFESMLRNTVAGLLANSGFSQSHGFVQQADAKTQVISVGKVISTDPPYYDNIGYADLSDFFYIWLKPALGGMYPDVFGTLATPKTDELVATPARHGGSSQAEAFFVNGMREAIERLEKTADPAFPATIYYAFKQSEIEAEGLTSKGWATFLEAIVAAGYVIVGTWPVRTERTNRIRAMGSNALANSVVLVCRKKEATADTITRAEFIRALKRELPPAIAELQAANIAPADMPQSAIGPGMGVFSRYKAVLEADDSPMTVKTALQLINAELDEFLGGIQGEFDSDTRFAITWFEQNGTGKGDYGVADNLARARGISVDSVKHAGIVESAAGKVRILKRDELDPEWDPQTDSHLTVWECLQYLVRQHQEDGISYDTALLLRKIDDKAEAVKDLAYCLYDICANKRQDAKEATAYNALIADWTELTRQAAAIQDVRGDGQTSMDI